MSPIAARPEDATLPIGAREALRVLTDRVALVAVVSGRPADVLAGLVDLPDVLYIGSHGMDSVRAGRLTRYQPNAGVLHALSVARDTVEGALDPEPGVFIEDKGLSFAVHYRLARDPEEAETSIRDAVARLVQPPLIAVQGRRVIEVRIASHITTGTALTELARREGLASLVYFGDDLTDAEAFEALAALRAGGAVQTLTVAVANPESPSVAQIADLTVSGVEDVLGVLGELGRPFQV